MSAPSPFYLWRALEEVSAKVLSKVPHETPPNFRYMNANFRGDDFSLASGSRLKIGDHFATVALSMRRWSHSIEMSCEVESGAPELQSSIVRERIDLRTCTDADLAARIAGFVRRCAPT